MATIKQSGVTLNFQNNSVMNKKLFSSDGQSDEREKEQIDDKIRNAKIITTVSQNYLSKVKFMRFTL